MERLEGEQKQPPKHIHEEECVTDVIVGPDDEDEDPAKTSPTSSSFLQLSPRKRNTTARKKRG